MPTRSAQTLFDAALDLAVWKGEVEVVQRASADPAPAVLLRGARGASTGAPFRTAGGSGRASLAAASSSPEAVPRATAGRRALAGAWNPIREARSSNG